MDDATLVIRNQSKFGQILSLIEQAQAVAATVTQETNALGGGAAATAGVDWNAMSLTQQEYFDALSSCANGLPTILGGHATNLYKAKS